MSPPPATAPDDHHEEYSFDSLGVRVPALLVSPWVDNRLEHTLFDHTSLLRYLTDKWQLRPLPSRRIAEANSIAIALTRTIPREDVLPRITLTPEQLAVPNLETEEKAAAVLSAHHVALQKLAAFLPRHSGRRRRARSSDDRANRPQIFY